MGKFMIALTMLIHECVASYSTFPNGKLEHFQTHVNGERPRPQENCIYCWDSIFPASLAQRQAWHIDVHMKTGSRYPSFCQECADLEGCASGCVKKHTKTAKNVI